MRESEPEPFPVAGPEAARPSIIYPEPESEREPICSRYPGSARKLCKIFPVAGLGSRSQTIFPGGGVETAASHFVWSQSWCWSHIFCPSSMSIIPITQHSLEYSARKALKDKKYHAIIVIGTLGRVNCRGIFRPYPHIFRSSIHTNITCQVQYHSLRYPGGGEGCVNGQRWDSKPRPCTEYCTERSVRAPQTHEGS